MVTSANDISFLLSGGPNNTDPSKSIGGEPSNTQISSGILNNLYDDVAPGETEAGFIDYRAFYVANDGDSTVSNVRLWIASEVAGGSTVQMGIENKNELQIVTISAPFGLTGGSVTYSIQDQNFLVVASPTDVETWSFNFETALLNLMVDGQPLFTDVTVTTIFVPAQVGSSFVHNIVYSGADGSKNQGALTLESNNLVPGSSIVLPATSSNGAPINTIAPLLDIDTTAPGGVIFSVPTEDNPIVLPKLNAGDSFPVWVKRETEAEVAPVANDGFTMKFSVDTF